VTTAFVEDIRARLTERLIESVGPRKYKMWFGETTLDCDGQSVQLHTPNRFVADWIGRHFTTNLRQAAAEELGIDTQVRVTIDASPASDDLQTGTKPGQSESFSGASAAPGSAAQVAQVQQPVRPAAPQPSAGVLRYDLNDYIVGPNNQLAYSSVCRLAEGAEHTLRTLFVHGGCGLGKTHLLQGLCRRYTAMHPAKAVRYTTAEQFTNEYIQAVRNNSLTRFRAPLRRLDLLAIDDVHFMANKPSTQAEFLHTFEHIDLHGAKLVMASDSHPKLIEQFSDALVSRMVGGMVVRVDAPDASTRRKIIVSLAQRQNLTLHESVIPVLADRSGGSVREIEGMLTTLKALAAMERPADLLDAPIGHALVERLWGASGKMRPARPIRLPRILAVVCEQVGVEERDVLAAGRHKQVVLARSLVAYLARQWTTMSFPDIARQMHRPNHSTIVTAVHRIEAQIKADEPVTIPSDDQPTTLGRLIERIKHRVGE